MKTKFWNEAFAMACLCLVLALLSAYIEAPNLLTYALLIIGSVYNAASMVIKRMPNVVAPHREEDK